MNFFILKFTLYYLFKTYSFQLQLFINFNYFYLTYLEISRNLKFYHFLCAIHQFNKKN